MPTVEEIQQHFIEGLNAAIRRPGMFGPGEIGPDFMLREVLYVTGAEPGAWRAELEAAGAWSSIGVTGVVQQLLPRDVQLATASVYADYAHRHGWLELDCTLPEREYGELRDQLADYCATDHALAEILERFGEPSRISGGGRYPCVLGYATAHDPIVWFYLWNGSNPGEPESWPVFEEPVLLATRCGMAPLEERFTFTPEGQRRRPEPYEPWREMLAD